MRASRVRVLLFNRRSDVMVAETSSPIVGSILSSKGTTILTV